MGDVDLIQRLIDSLLELPQRDEGELDALRRRARMIIGKIFGDSSHYLSDLGDINFHPRFAPSTEKLKDQIWISGKKEMLNLFKTMQEDLQLGNKNTATPTTDGIARLSDQIFIVHGHDQLPKEELARMLTEIGFRSIILHERSNQGRTIIEKFEEECRDVTYAFVIMTPDDVGMDRELYEKRIKGEYKNGLNFRARQNVVFELGFFFAKLGRGRVSCLCRGNNIERPADIDGILYIPFKDSVKEKYQDIIRELKAAGYKPSI